MRSDRSGGAGVLLGTGIIAVLVRYTFPYHWSWTEALLFGAMMAATDPVATVAVLGQVQARQIGRSVELCYTAAERGPDITDVVNVFLV